MCVMRCTLVAALLLSGAFALRLRTSDCPLCVAEDNCHIACADVRGKNPGSQYCLDACNGAHPDDTFGEDWFTNADRKMKASADLTANIKKIGQELAAEVAAQR
mmetsp:Transcript_70305/g.139348  ORF Transcript_70305/g.139348 Transcript_70305/m.139348 type:complete len:104 (-) Transcript_70305:74-385(-)